MIFALTYLRDMGNRAKAVGGEEAKEAWKKKADAVYRAMLEKLRGLDMVYLTIDKNTNFPFYNGGFVDIYTREEYAKLAVLFYAEQFRELEVVALPVANPQLLKPEERKLPALQYFPALLVIHLPARLAKEINNAGAKGRVCHRDYSIWLVRKIRRRKHITAGKRSAVPRLGKCTSQRTGVRRWFP